MGKIMDKLKEKQPEQLTKEEQKPIDGTVGVEGQEQKTEPEQQGIPIGVTQGEALTINELQRISSAVEAMLVEQQQLKVMLAPLIKYVMEPVK